jgi:Lhr-like helicase
MRRGGQQWNSERIFDRLYEADPSFPLLRETIRVVTQDMLDSAGAKAYLAALPAEPRVVHPAAASPFTFGIVTSSFGDSVVIDDRTSMVEALHDRVLEVLGEKPRDVPAEEPSSYNGASGPLFDGVARASDPGIARVVKIKNRRTPRRARLR